jgi:hypothetical protein
MDIKRKSDPEYHRGWNSFTGLIKTPSAPDVQESPVKQNTTDIPEDPENGSASRLNAQELKGLRGE